MKRLLITLVVLTVVVVAVDRVGAAVATRAVASQVTATGEVMDPSVSINGFPFLTQALSGRYDDIEVSGTGVTGDQGVSEFDARLTGVRLPLAEALSGRVSAVPVDRIEATVLLPYASLERRLGERRLRLSAAGDLLRVTGSVNVLGRTLSASALSSVRVDGKAVVVTAQRFEVGSKPADKVLSAALGSRLDFRVTMAALPYGLVLQSVQVEPAGVRARATAQSAVLTR